MNTISPDDMRRAAALIQHHSTGDVFGMNAIAEEAAEADRAAELILSILTIYQEIVPELRTDLGMSLMSSYIYKLAGMEQES